MNPHNLVVIMSDEHHPRAIGAAGHPFVHTPNLDRLAARGTLFDAAYCNCPICVPSRASFATGRYVHELGTWDNAMAYDGSVPGWGHALQQTGHRVDSIGKLHYRNAEDPTGFDHQYHPMHIYGGYGMVWGALRDGKADFSDRAHVMMNPIGPGTSKYNIYDDRIATEAENWIARAAGEKHDRPWVLYIGFVAPHFPLTVPQDILDLYPVDRMPYPRLHPKNGFARHPWLEASHHLHPVDDGLDDERRLLATACYYGLCTWVDRQVGRVIDALERGGLSDTTRVIYTSDHGDNIGARGMWGKSTHYDDAVGVPMIVAGPDVPAGRVCHTPVSLIDLAPTIMDAVGEDPMAWAEQPLPGKSLFEIGREKDDPERTVFSEYHAFGSPSAAFMLRNGHYKYNYYVGYSAELFDLRADPGEEHDLAADPKYASIVSGFEAELRALIEPEAVDALAKTAQAALIAHYGGPEKAMNVGAPGATPAPV
ncbi:MAG TPA: sulfatase-like hydrolase/transferase [Hyphomicrobiaceae bacterium]|nr:sulfatase-like hydrolase/transferase [Hyphomicrobiaceae bacterium]